MSLVSGAPEFVEGRDDTVRLWDGHLGVRSPAHHCLCTCLVQRRFLRSSLADQWPSWFLWGRARHFRLQARRSKLCSARIDVVLIQFEAQATGNTHCGTRRGILSLHSSPNPSTVPRRDVS
mmetsp:Transcript_8909/g.24823  ORF Transcript_8909/g.24823 Transcript_8909/m.24823 type:complete len:121 (-) Transcript_8909:87-449(-)